MPSIADSTPLWRPDPATVGDTAWRSSCNPPVTAATKSSGAGRWTLSPPPLVIGMGFLRRDRREGHHGSRRRRPMPGARWFPEARLNYAENMLQRRDDSDALVFWGEAKGQTAADRDRLYADVSRFIGVLRGRRRRRRRPGGGLPAQPAGNPDCHAGHRLARAPSGPRPRRISASRAFSTVSARSSPRSSSASTATGITARPSIAWRRTPKWSRKCRPWSGPSSCRRAATPDVGRIAHALIPGMLPSPPSRPGDIPTAAWPSIIPCSSCFPPAPPGFPSASSIATAACSCNTSRNSSCTATYGLATACSTTPPAAG